MNIKAKMVLPGFTGDFALYNSRNKFPGDDNNIYKPIDLLCLQIFHSTFPRPGSNYECIKNSALEIAKVSVKDYRLPNVVGC
jgi:hypothetical protein